MVSIQEFPNRKAWLSYWRQRIKKHLNNAPKSDWTERQTIRIFWNNEEVLSVAGFIPSTIIHKLQDFGLNVSDDSILWSSNEQCVKLLESAMVDGVLDGNLLRTNTWSSEHLIPEAFDMPHIDLFLTDLPLKSGENVWAEGDFLTGTIIFSLTGNRLEKVEELVRTARHETVHLLGFDTHHELVQVGGYQQADRCLMRLEAPTSHICPMCSEAVQSIWAEIMQQQLEGGGEQMLQQQCNKLAAAVWGSPQINAQLQKAAQMTQEHGKETCFLVSIGSEQALQFEKAYKAVYSESDPIDVESVPFYEREDAQWEEQERIQSLDQAQSDLSELSLVPQINEPFVGSECSVPRFANAVDGRDVFPQGHGYHETPGTVGLFHVHTHHSNADSWVRPSLGDLVVAAERGMVARKQSNPPTLWQEASVILDADSGNILILMRDTEIHQQAVDNASDKTFEQVFGRKALYGTDFYALGSAFSQYPGFMSPLYKTRWEKFLTNLGFTFMWTSLDELADRADEIAEQFPFARITNNDVDFIK